jgi:hypothetical protein
MVVAVLLADGWHRIVPGSFSVGPLSFDAEAGLGTPGFRFEEADPARPYRPATLAGPLGSILAVRQVNSADYLSALDSPGARHGGHLAPEDAVGLLVLGMSSVLVRNRRSSACVLDQN